MEIGVRKLTRQLRGKQERWKKRYIDKNIKPIANAVTKYGKLLAEKNDL